MSICANCGKETNSDYVVKELSVLCAECANEKIDIHIKELSKAIDNLISKQTFLNKEKIRLKQLDCDHEWIATGYGTCDDGNFVSVHYCSKCHKTKNISDWKVE